ncbi:MAG TPA: GNAT family N-acetyltransferase [Ktedonobacterales bacterium]|nr:GNAT family N-acetyltransferase [Ktedonobacterales bacterium]
MRIHMETERLILRRFTEADADNLFALDSDPQVMRWLTGGAPTPRSVIERDILPAFIRSYALVPGFGVWAATERASGDFVGWFAIRPPEGAETAEVASLGYRLRRAVWGRGYATEGARALIRQGFTDLGVRCVIADTYQDNLASRRVMEKLSMTLARTYRPTLADLQASDSFDGAAVQDVWDGDDVEYELTKADWEQSQNDNP